MQYSDITIDSSITEWIIIIIHTIQTVFLALSVLLQYVIARRKAHRQVFKITFLWHRTKYNIYRRSDLSYIHFQLKTCKQTSHISNVFLSILFESNMQHLVGDRISSSGLIPWYWTTLYYSSNTWEFWVEPEINIVCIFRRVHSFYSIERIRFF